SAIGRSHDSVDRVRRRSGGVPPRRGGESGRCLSLAEREEISRGCARGQSFAAIAGGLGRAPSTVGREVHANGDKEHYRAFDAERRAYDRARRPKVAKLARCPRLAAAVTEVLSDWCSPQQFARRVPLEYTEEQDVQGSYHTVLH